MMVDCSGKMRQKLVRVAAAILDGRIDDAEDVVQDVYCEIVQKRPDIRDEERYLIAAVTKRAIDEGRRASRHAVPMSQVGR